MKHLLFWSGGIDSTAVLKWRLEQGHHVLAHHVEMRTCERRHEAELHAVAALKPHFASYGPNFEFRKSMIEMDFGNAPLRDMAVLGVIGAAMARADRTIDRVEYGHCSEESSRNSWTRAIFKAVAPELPADILYVTAEISFKNQSKAEHMRYLGREIVDKTWACRRPLYGDDGPIACGGCFACHRMRQMKRELGW